TSYCFFSSRRRHTRSKRDWSSDVCSSDLSIRHRDILGSLMSLGIERKTLGDISVRDGIFQFFINREMASYVQMNLTQVKQSTVKLQSKSYEERIESAENWLERQ